MVVKQRMHWNCYRSSYYGKFWFLSNSSGILWTAMTGWECNSSPRWRSMCDIKDIPHCEMKYLWMWSEYIWTYHAALVVHLWALLFRGQYKMTQRWPPMGEWVTKWSLWFILLFVLPTPNSEFYSRPILTLVWSWHRSYGTIWYRYSFPEFVKVWFLSNTLLFNGQPQPAENATPLREEVLRAIFSMTNSFQQVQKGSVSQDEASIRNNYYFFRTHGTIHLGKSIRNK